MSPRPVRTDLTVIRAVLDDLAAGLTPTQAARRHQISDSGTVTKWRRRAAATPGWPTPADIVAQAEYWAEHRARLEARRVAEHVYRRTVYVQRGPMLVPTAGTGRRLRALQAIGWTQTDLAARLGVTHQRVSRLTNESYDAVHRTVAARVAGVYDDLSMTVPQDVPPGERPAGYQPVYDKQRRRVRALGWPPPLAWDDDTIDDPAAEASWVDPTAPRAGVVASMSQKRAALVRDLYADGADLWAILRAVGMRRNAFQTWCTRHGLSEVYSDLSTRAIDRAGLPGNQHTRGSAA